MIRSKRYTTGDYLEIEVFNLAPHRKPFARASRVKESSPAQKKLNEKRAKRYFRRLCNLNFRKGDIALTLTCDDDHYPESREELIKWVKNYIRRLKRLWEKSGGKKGCFKYVYVISNHAGDGSGSKARPHVHTIISGMDRDAVEEKWDKGYANADRLQFDENGIGGLAKYMTDQARSERSWSSSTNLLKPEPVVSDKAFTRTQIDRIVNDPGDGLYIEKLINTGKTRWTFVDCHVEYDGRELFGSEIDTGEGMGVSLLIRARKESWQK